MPVRKRKVNILEALLPFISLILAIALYAALLIAFVKQEFPDRESVDPPVHAVTAYSNKWNLYVSSCQELYFATSDHTAFNEGCRYSVLRGFVPVSSATTNRRGERLTKRTGSGWNENIGYMLDDVYRILEIPADARYSMADCDWTVISSENGSRVLVARNESENIMIIAEELR